MKTSIFRLSELSSVMRKAVAKTKRNGHPAVIAFHVRITTIEVSKEPL